MSIIVRDVNKSFGDFAALTDVSVEIPSGSLTALLGPSGGGKSTLLRVIAGLEKADSGLVEIEGKDATTLPAQDRGVGFVFQHYAAFKHLSVARNVAFVSNLMESGVEFTAVDFPQANRLTVHILAAVAEHEAKAISERTRAALKAARDRGQRLGGDRGNLPALAQRGAAISVAARRHKAARHAADLVSTIRELQAGGASLRQVAAELTRRHIPTPRPGGAWSATQVTRILNRVGV